MSLFDSRTALVVVALLAGVVGAEAQSLTSLRGLGYPIIAADARTEALDGLGVGLMGLAVPFTNPASPARVRQRGVVVSAAATERTSTLGDISASSGATRFPVLRVLFPMGRVVLTGGYGTYLDQAWAVTRQGSQTLGTGQVGYTDVITSTGGVGQAQLGVAIPVGSDLALGVAVGTYTGRQDVNIRRQFDTTSVGSLQPYQETRAFQYGGLVTQLGFQWDLQGVVRLGGSFTWSGRLKADSAQGPVSSTEYELPVQVAAGASAYLSPGLLAAVSGRWSGWSVTDPTEGLVESGEGASSRDTWEIGAGIELDNPERRATRSFPLRLGFQYRQLPFAFVSDQPKEWLASLGVGMRIGADFDTPLARFDLTIQRGGRTAGGDGATPGLDESVWRFALGLSIFGT